MEIKDRIRRSTEDTEDWYIDITDLALELFDNDLLASIIEKVEVEAPYRCTNEDKALILLTREYIESIKEGMSEYSDIELEASSMFITFTNGKKIELWNSEWGGIRVDVDDR